jgi:hypothetical protein
MRKKYVREIRTGIMLAHQHVELTQRLGYVPWNLSNPSTDLMQKAYDRTMRKLVAQAIIDTGKRMLKTVEGFIDADDDSVKAVEAAISYTEDVKKTL